MEVYCRRARRAENGVHGFRAQNLVKPKEYWENEEFVPRGTPLFDHVESVRTPVSAFFESTKSTRPGGRQVQGFEKEKWGYIHKCVSFELCFDIMMIEFVQKATTLSP